MIHQHGIVFIENKDILLNKDKKVTETIKGDLGIQIAKDGRVWICIDGIAFIRFTPKTERIEEDM